MRGFIIESEWRNGKGWRFFASELRGSVLKWVLFVLETF
jgi:hypothetical protein